MHKRILNFVMCFMLGMSVFSAEVRAEETGLEEDTENTVLTEEQESENTEETEPVTEEVPDEPSEEEETAEEDVPEESEPAMEQVHDEWINPDYIGTIGEPQIDTRPVRRAVRSSAVASVPEFSSVSDAGAYVREQMKARNETITFTYTFPVQYDKAIIDEIWDDAYRHTGVPDEGDYLRWQNGGYGMNGSGYGNQWTMTFTTSYYTTAAQEAQVDSQTASVINSLGLNGKTDEQKIRLVHDYIVDHVTYDYVNLGNEDYKLQYTAYAALINGTAVCQGYSLLTYRLMLMAGIDCRIITGEADNGTGKGGHAWNIVEADGVYYFLDTTWDDGTHSDNYYMKSGFDDHFIDEERFPASFFDEYPIFATVDSGTCGDGLSWALTSNGVLTVSGNGSMALYNTTNTPPWYAQRKNIQRAVIEEGAVNIGNYAFYNCPNLTEAVIPAGVESIGNGAFYKCSSLQRIDYQSCAGDWQRISRGNNNDNLDDVDVECSGMSAGTWEWADDFSSVSLHLYCPDHGELELTVEGTVSSETVPPTAVEEGYTVYTGQVYYNGDTFSDMMTIMIPVESPTKVSLTNVSSTGYPSLTWEKRNCAVTYQVYRSEEKSGTYKRIANVAETGYIDTNAVGGTEYFYKVRCVGTDGQAGKFSSIVNIKALPAAPSGVSAKNNPATGNIKISWNEARDAYKYQVYRAASVSGTYTRIATTENTQYIDSKGESGKTYYYKVRSVTENGVYSKYSSKKSAKCSETFLTVTVKNVTATGYPNISWNSAGTVKYYQLYRSDSADGTYTKLVNTTALSRTDETAEAGKTYWYKVRAIDTDNKSGSYSEPVSIVCKPGRVTGLKAGIVTSTGKPKLTWTAVEDAAKYQVYYSVSKTGTYKRLTTTAGTSYTHTGAAAGTVYYYKVRAVTDNGTYGAYSTIINKEAVK